MISRTQSCRPREFYGRHITRKQLLDIQRTVELMSGLSRHELAHTICEHLGWRASSGEDSTCLALGLLETLEREGLLHLPAKDESRIRGARKASARTAAGESGERIECDLSSWAKWFWSRFMTRTRSGCSTSWSIAITTFESRAKDGLPVAGKQEFSG